MGRKKKPLTRRQFIKKVQSIVKRYGRVRIVSQDANYEPPCDCMCKSCRAQFEVDDYIPDQRRRLIKKDGSCYVSYKTEGHKKWSGFSESCFMDNYYDESIHDDCDTNFYGGYECNCEPKKTVKQTLEFMLDHDSCDVDLKPIMLEYGKRFKRKLIL